MCEGVFVRILTWTRFLDLGPDERTQNATVLPPAMITRLAHGARGKLKLAFVTQSKRDARDHFDRRPNYGCSDAIRSFPNEGACCCTIIVVVIGRQQSIRELASDAECKSGGRNTLIDVT